MAFGDVPVKKLQLSFARSSSLHNFLHCASVSATTYILVFALSHPPRYFLGLPAEHTLLRTILCTRHGQVYENIQFTACEIITKLE